ncbi:hypothetical protein BGZ80_004920 [Entomortierella chlamydospora]|uniref:Uncharacterized protein n=1 Tax=Entomortierella chlamydospora TaxID=101097 RepID=A0A9P6MLJ2_9FUNG|nr:hypothetical protein BGZ80_004920 [Entomortierella chlamydospora]
MKTFKEFVATDSHKHPNYDKQYACYTAYIGRQRKAGDVAAQNYELSFELLKKEYDSLKMDGTISVSRDSAGKIIEASMHQYTSEAVQKIGGESLAPASYSSLVPTPASSSSDLATVQPFGSDEETLDDEDEGRGIMTSSMQHIPKHGTETKKPSVDDVVSDEEVVDFTIFNKTEQGKSELILCVTPPYRPPGPSDTESSEPELAINSKLGKHRLDQHDGLLWDSPNKHLGESEGEMDQTSRSQIGPTMGIPLPHQHTTSTSASASAPAPLSQCRKKSKIFSYSEIFAFLRQKTTWETTFDIGGYFSRIRGSLKSSFDISKDNIMDMTSASAFVMSLSDETYTEAMEDMPTLDFGLEEIKELKIIMEPECSFEELRDRIYGMPLDTPVRRYVYGVIESYAAFFDDNSVVPELEEKQGMFDVICPFVRGAFRVFRVPSNISEIAIMATGERRNFNQNYEDRLRNCKRADIVAADKDGIQIFLAECAMLHEKDVRKFTEDRWKVARCMKDIWDFGMRRTTQVQSPHENFSTFGLHSFGQELHFLQLDFRSSYRLWEIETCRVPLEIAGFWKKMITCCQTSLAFTKAVITEVERRKGQEMLSQKERLSLMRTANNIPRTTVSPPKPKIKKQQSSPIY